MGGTERFLPPNLKDYITKREIMPFYSFRCTDCSYRFELMRSVSERDEMAECPECKKQQATRLLSIPVLFTRSGGGEPQIIGGSSGCGSCSSTACGSCSSGNN